MTKAPTPQQAQELSGSAPARAKRSASAQESLFAQVDQALLAGGKGVDRAMALLDEQERQIRWRRQWAIVEAVWVACQEHPWILEAQVNCEWGGKGVAQWEDGCTIADEDELKKRLKGIKGLPDTDPVKRRHSDFLKEVLEAERAGNPDDYSLIARLRVADDLDEIEWKTIDFGDERRGKRLTLEIPMGPTSSREKLARFLLQGDSLAAWEAAFLRKEVSAAASREISTKGRGTNSDDKPSQKRVRAGAGRL